MRGRNMKDKNFYQKVQMSHLKVRSQGAAGEKENPSLRLKMSQQEKEEALTNKWSLRKHL